MASTSETTSTTTTSTKASTASTATSTQSTTSTTTATTGPQTANATVTSPAKGLDGGAIAGIVVGSVVFVIIIIVVIIVVILAIKRRRRTQRPISGGEVPSEQNKERDENKKKRTENKYVKKDLPKIKPPEPDYENPQGNYYNVEGQNREELSLKNDSDANNDKTKGSRKPAVMKQNSVPAAYAPPPPIVQDSRTSVPVEKAPDRPVIEEDEYIIPEDLSKINIAKQPVYIEPERPNIDSGHYFDMKCTPGEELYIDPDSGGDQMDYMNFDAKSKTVKDEEKKEGAKEYVNLSNQEKGVAFGVKPKPSHVKPKREATPPVTTSDAEFYQNVEYENSPKQSKKTKGKK